jgi:hypothetical protein
MENYLENAHEVWDDIEPEISKLRYEKWVDPILVDKFDALINHYNGNSVTGSPTAVLGKLESLITMLSMDSYYRTRNTSEPEKKRLLALNDNLNLLRQILVAIQREEEKNRTRPEYQKKKIDFQMMMLKTIKNMTYMTDQNQTKHLNGILDR